MPDPDGFLYGLSDGYWHKLTRHDPDYENEFRASERLTALKQAAADRIADQSGVERSDVEPVMVMLPAKAANPGVGRTRCGIEGLKLEAIGVDPEDGDPVCPACKVLGPTT